ncbi:hypothetical protein HF1_02450 [Mycoplasma haemofelis str. Langford 1]|uniref:Uncharacterized protein n=1 Tax=Mycoplasma haemofelis (strain Langford 1) TaxID=941640 RepID=E8ZKT7_MYCHL|nr:hypothetical protein [Mycoplasma haemofelis]CBY92253.1 hypothetical protein HF1_02450 [Mycoplasma haemofelis str. Langford 1]
MEASLLAKSAAGVLGLGTATAGAVYFGRDLVGGEDKVKTPIKELIKTANPHKRLIEGSTVSDPHWKEVWKEYRNANLNKGVDFWNIQGWQKPTGNVTNSDDASSHFISACSSKLNEEVESSKDPLYLQVISYCTRDALISDLIKEKGNGKTLLSKEGNDSEAWKAVWTSYKTGNTNKAKGQDKWGLSDWDTKNNDVSAPDSFKDKCKEKSEKKTVDSSEDDYKEVLDWCTK